MKAGLHPRNLHRAHYDFALLTRACPALTKFVRLNAYGDTSIDFADPAAVKTLNQALLCHHYAVTSWDIPAGYLCPPIPGRADYLHHLADLLGRDQSEANSRGNTVAVLDIGVGANCVFPIIGVHAYGWRFVGSETDPVALANARRIVAANPALVDRVQLRQQIGANAIFRGIIAPGEHFEASMCNPPFHASPAEAAAGTRRKLKNLGGTNTSKHVLNFGGQAGELWCEGGEAAFVKRMIIESVGFAGNCRWFTTLVSKAEHLAGIQRALRAVSAAEVAIISMAQGQKRSRIVAWTFEQTAPSGPLKRSQRQTFER